MTSTQQPASPPIADAAVAAREGRGSAHDSVWYWLRYGVSAGLLAIILGIAVIAVVVPRVVGAVPLTVLTSSMEPTLPPGAMIVVRPLTQHQLGDIRIGDVISFQPYPNDDTLVTHRVVGIRQHQTGSYVFTTQGDANSRADAPVRGIQVRAKLWYSIRGLGWANDLINQQGNRSWIIPSVAGLLFAYAGYTACYSLMAYVRRKRSPPTAVTEEAEAAVDEDELQPH